MSEFGKENKVQMEAIVEMHGEMIELMLEHSPGMRKTINYFKAKEGRLPVAAEIIWIASVDADPPRDLRKPREEYPSETE